jgi:hypothetical protein
MKKSIIFFVVLAIVLPSIAMSKDSLLKYSVKRLSINMTMGEVLELYPDFTLDEGDQVIYLTIKNEGKIIARAEFDIDGEMQSVEGYYSEKKIYSEFGIHPFEPEISRAVILKENIKEHVDLTYYHKQEKYRSVIEGDEDGNIFFRNAKFESPEAILSIKYLIEDDEKRFAVRIKKNHTAQKFVAANVKLD